MYYQLEQTLTKYDMKTESQHTPGPWRISAPDKERVGDWGKRSLFYKSGIDGKYMGFIVFNPSSCDDNEAEANAQLIASAPDLLKERDEIKAENERIVANTIETVRSLQNELNTSKQNFSNLFSSHDNLRFSEGRLKSINAELLEALKKTYLSIQILVQSKINKGEFFLAVETDGIRADLRNAITAATGEDAQTLQESIEAEAYNKAKGL